jgi:2-amino-4-hydroxy-6-hydroxymethyldihydropteridine diphosphokinase
MTELDMATNGGGSEIVAGGAPPLDCVVGLGANLGEPLLAFRRALGELGQISEIVAVSALYRSAPVGGPKQPDFLNAAVRLRYGGTAPALLAGLLAIERAAGRERRERWGPRTLDLDLLWIAGIHIDSPELEVPHPRLRSRQFALVPLLDVAPDARDPRDGKAFASVSAELGADGLRRLAAVWVAADPRVMPVGMDRPGC